MNKQTLNPRPLLWFLIATAAAFYAAQLMTPLRLNYDALDFLRMATSAADGFGFYPDKTTERYPLAYPYVLLWMASGGVLGSFSIVALNLGFVALGTIAAALLAGAMFGQKSIVVPGVMVFTLFSWVMVKHVTLPLSDLMYFGVSMWCLVAITKALQASGIAALLYFTFGAVLLAVAVATRHVGACLGLAFAWAVYVRLTSGWSHGRRCDRVLALGGVAISLSFLLLIALSRFELPLPEYIKSIFHEDQILRTAFARLADIGALVLNANLARFGMSPAFVGASFILGLAVVLACFACLFPSRGRIPPVFVYLCSYLWLIFMTPWEDTRYFLPVLPLIAFSLARPIVFLASQGSAWVRIGLPLWTLIYVCLGVAAFAYSTWLSLSGPRFAERFGTPHTREMYQAFYRDKKTPNAVASDYRAEEFIRILQRFDPARKGSLSNRP